MTPELTLDRLWEMAPPATHRFDADRFAHLPAQARSYLAHAIAPGTPLASAVRLRMHGEIRIGKWRPFAAEQVILWPRGLIWQASVGNGLVRFRGSDRLFDGTGAMRWKLFGLIPVVTGAGPDISRSALGRLLGEAVLLPSVFCRPEVTWSGGADGTAAPVLNAAGETAELALRLGAGGKLESLRYPRWGNPGGGAFRYEPFGGVIEEEAAFQGYTIPSRMRLGWYWGTDRFAADGEFFHGCIDTAEFR